MSVMKAVKNVLEWVAIVALIVFIFSPPQARADGMHGVTVTKTEILVQVPFTCRPLVFEWEGIYERTEGNKNLVMSFIQNNDGKFDKIFFKKGHYKVRTIWSGGKTLQIPLVDAQGNRIEYGLVTILAIGGGEKLMNRKNWVFIFSDGKVMDMSPPVNRGTWGEC